METIRPEQLKAIDAPSDNQVPAYDFATQQFEWVTAALLNQANSFTLINPLTTIAESWIGPSSTNGIYFKAGNVGIGTITPVQKLDVSGKIALDGTVVAYRPTAMTGTLVLGDGGNSLEHTGGDEGYHNTFVGLGAGNFNTTGSHNSAIGSYALYSNTTGNYNSAIGTSTLQSNTTGSQNTAIGHAALQSNTTGNYNSAIGTSTLQSNTTGGHNSAVGYAALQSNTTGGQNSAIGSYALYSNTTGNYNNAIGTSTLQSNTTGSQNTAIGHAALQSNTTGNYNSAIGTSTLQSNTTGIQNAAIGHVALQSNTTGGQNSAVGSYALYSNTTGNYNSAIGTSTLQSNTTGIQNAAIGHAALQSNTTGGQNSAIGSYALYSNTTVSQNTAIGYAALQSNTTGSQNTAIGIEAGRYQADGLTPLTDPENSVYLGGGARGYDNSDNNSIVIGYNAIGLGANTVVLGNDSIVTTALKGDVGIGTTAPGYKLHVYTDSAGKPGAGGLWTVVSDERIKENIVLADLDRCYEIVKAIPLKRFTFKDTCFTPAQVQDRSALGWIAQDVKSIFPKAVGEIAFKLPNSDEVIEDCQDLNAGQIIAALYGAVQKLIDKVEKLEKIKKD